MKHPRFRSFFRILGVVLLPFAGLSLLVSFTGPTTGVGDALSMLLPAVLVTAASIYLLLGAPHLDPVLDAVFDFFKIESRLESGRIFIQTGGARCGDSFWSSWNCTVPFAQLRVTHDAIVLSALLGFSRRTFTLPRSSIRCLRWKRALFSLGLQIEHRMPEYPPFLLFWVMDRKFVTEGLKAFGYELKE
jgi:hypothetical protein